MQDFKERQDWIHELQTTINWFQLGLNLIIEATHHEIKTTINWFQLVLQLIIETNHNWFQAGLHSNLLILDVLGNHFWTFWNPGRPRWHQFGDHLVPGFTQEGFWASQCRFVSTFDEFGMPYWDHFWVIVWYFMWVWMSKNMFGLQARLVYDVWSNNLLISDVRTSQKHNRNICVR